MRVLTATLVACAAAAVSGCASHPEPIIDMKGVDQEQFVQDWNECEAYADEVQMSKGVAKGAGLGAVLGAAVGAIGGNSRDVAEGAAYGGVAGGTDSGLQADREKQYVFKNCMSGRGYRVLN